MKKGIAGITLVVALLGFFWWKSAASPVKIGVCLPNDTAMGYEEDLAVRFYRDTFPQAGKHDVEFIIRNPQSSEDEIRKALRALSDLDVSAIVGGEISKNGIILADESAQSGIVTFGVTSSTDTLSNRQDAFYRLVPSAGTLGEKLAGYLDSKDVKDVGILASGMNKAYSLSLADGFQKKFTGKSELLLFEDDTDLETLLTTVEAASWFLILPGDQLVQAIRLLKNRDTKVQIYSSEWGFDQLMTLYGGNDIEGVFSCTRRQKFPAKNFHDMVTQFEARYDLRASFASVTTFAVLDALYKAIAEVGGDRDKLRGWFDEPRDYHNGYGPIRLNEFGDAFSNAFFIHRIDNGELKLVDKIEHE